MEKKCRMCGKEFTVSVHNKTYCSFECKSKVKRYRSKKDKRANLEKITEINRRANELNMNYGDYVAKYGL